MKLSLPAYFRTTYGELLAPKGFRLLKNKVPYFVRVTSGGIVQSISFSKEKQPLIETLMRALRSGLG